MKHVPLTNSDKLVIVDDEDYALLSRYSWGLNDKGHVKSRIYLGEKHHTILIHRLIMNPSGKQQVDHINRDKLDNRKENLRICYSQENSWNRSVYEFDKTSKYKGVSFAKRQKKWTAYITCDGIRYHLGYFADEKEAALAYNRKAIELYSADFAVINNVEGN